MNGNSGDNENEHQECHPRKISQESFTNDSPPFGNKNNNSTPNKSSFRSDAPSNNLVVKSSSDQSKMASNGTIISTDDQSEDMFTQVTRRQDIMLQSQPLIISHTYRHIYTHINRINVVKLTDQSFFVSSNNMNNKASSEI